MRVLLIDDDEIVRELLSSTLKRFKHEVYELASAMGAARLIFEQSIDAVVIDVNLPDLSGDKLARVLRQNSRDRGLGIVLVSSLPVDELERLTLFAEADDMVAKSNIRSGLEPAIRRACQRCAAVPQLS